MKISKVKSKGRLIFSQGAELTLFRWVLQGRDTHRRNEAIFNRALAVHTCTKLDGQFREDGMDTDSA